jgi:hypothetical protein
MVRVPIAPQVEAQVPQGPSGAPQFQAPPMPGMQESQQLAQDIGRAGQMAMDVQRDEQALALYQQRLEARATAERQATIAARQDEIDKTMLKGAETLFNNRIGEVSDAFKRRKGLAVVPGFGEAESVINTAIEEVEESLPEELRPKWRYQAQMLVLPFRRGMLDHVGKEVDEASRQGADQHIVNLGDAAKRLSSSALDPKGDFAVFAGAAMNEIDEVVKRDGYGPNSPQAMKRKREWWSDVSQSITDDMADQGRFEDAMKFVGGVNSAGMLPKEEFDKIRDGLEAAESVYSSTQTAQELFDSGDDVNAMIELVRRADRPQDWIDNTIKRINALESQRAEEEKREYDGNYQRAQDFVWDAEAARTGLPSMNKLPLSLAKKLRQEDVRKLYDLPLYDDQAAIDEVRQRIIASQSPDGEAFTDRDLQKYRARMKPSTFNGFRETLSSPEKIREVTLNDDVFKVVAKQQGLEENLISPKTDDEHAQKAAIRLQWEKSIRAYESGKDKNGRPLVADRDKMAELLSEILTTRMFDKNIVFSGFSAVSDMSGVYAASILPSAREGRYLQLTPDGGLPRYIEIDRYEGVVRKLRENGIEVSPTNVVRGYNQMFGRMPAVSAPGMGSGSFTGQGFPGSPSDRFGTRYVPERPPVAPQDR